VIRQGSASGGLRKVSQNPGQKEKGQLENNNNLILLGYFMILDCRARLWLKKNCQHIERYPNVESGD
jgi:hypothetical protein